MKDIINASDIQRKGWKDVYKVIEQYGQAYIVNQRNEDVLVVSKENRTNEANSALLSIIKSLKTIKQELTEKYKVGKLGICGSYSRGDYTNESDLDIVVDSLPIDFHVVGEIERLIEKTTKVEKVDLLIEKDIKPKAWHTIKEDVIYVWI